MSDYDLFEGQNCPCGNDPACSICGAAEAAYEQYLEEMHRQEIADQILRDAHLNELRGERPF